MQLTIGLSELPGDTAALLHTGRWSQSSPDLTQLGIRLKINSRHHIAERRQPGFCHNILRPDKTLTGLASRRAHTDKLRDHLLLLLSRGLAMIPLDRDLLTP